VPVAGRPRREHLRRPPVEASAPRHAGADGAGGREVTGSSSPGDGGCPVAMVCLSPCVGAAARRPSRVLPPRLPPAPDGPARSAAGGHRAARRAGSPQRRPAALAGHPAPGRRRRARPGHRADSRAAQPAHPRPGQPPTAPPSRSRATPNAIPTHARSLVRTLWLQRHRQGATPTSPLFSVHPTGPRLGPVAMQHLLATAATAAALRLPTGIGHWYRPDSGLLTPRCRCY
jgi:hypothetical protein